MHTASRTGHVWFTSRNWQRIRFALGFVQMAGVAFSLALLFWSGVNKYSLAAVVLTCLATSVSVLLFGRRP